MEVSPDPKEAFEEAYRKYPFAPLVRLGIAFGAWIAGLRPAPERTGDKLPERTREMLRRAKAHEEHDARLDRTGKSEAFRRSRPDRPGPAGEWFGPDGHRSARRGARWRDR